MAWKTTFASILIMCSVNVSAGWLSDRVDSVGDSLRDARNDVNDALNGIDGKEALDDFADSIGDRLRNLGLGIHSSDPDEQKGGYGDEELVLNIDEIYLPHMDNKGLLLSNIEGTGQVFSWVPISSLGINIFIPHYSSKIPVMPTDSDIWNNVDRDSDGIYDDIEYFAVRNFSDSPDTRYAIYRYANSLKQLVDNVGLWNEFKSASINFARSERCLEGAANTEQILAIKVSSLSTLNRIKAYQAFHYMKGDTLLMLNRTGDLRCK